MQIRRRDLLAGTALFVLSGLPSRATLISGQIPWEPDAGNPPPPVTPGGWHFFTAPEASAVEAIADRIIPPDPETPGGKDAGCAVFVDRQLAGPYGRREGLYTQPPFMKGTKQQGSQTDKGPAQIYREALAALDRYCQATFGGKTFASLSDADKDNVLHGLESGKVALEGADGQSFFAQMVTDVQTGFFADPIYGGNRNMVAWKMIGFPGARYNYLDWVNRHNERYPLPPVSMTGRAEWTPKNG
jgi:gluconate 2-dehydrogenase gamma chain